MTTPSNNISYAAVELWKILLLHGLLQEFYTWYTTESIHETGTLSGSGLQDIVVDMQLLANRNLPNTHYSNFALWLNKQ